MFKEYDPVKIVSLLKSDREFHGSEEVARAPRVEDTGIIVAMSGNKEERAYVVESVNPDGMTIWIADFHEDELALADESIKQNYYIPVAPKTPIYLLGALLGSITAYFIATYWLGLSPWWASPLLGTIGALFGLFMLENIGEAIVLTAILCVLVAIVLTTTLGFITLKAGAVPLVCGFCVGKLVVGSWKEIRG